jgi:antirestriction protein ArdC
MKTTTTTPKNVYQMVTDRIIAQMEQGIIPWRKPWHGLNNANPAEVAISYETRRAYSLLNQFLLGEPGEYLTFNQIKAHGGMIRKGERSRMVVFYTQIVKEDPSRLDEEGNPKVVRIPVLKYYNVWNINQVDGIESKAGAVVEPKQPINPEEAAEAIVDGYMTSSNHPKLIVKNSDKAYYCPAGDYVVVPEMQQYDDVAEYYSTLFHELTHSTGHSTRCNRKGITALAAFGGENYSKEELVAEIGAAMLVSQAAIPAERAFKNSVAYLQSWLRALKNDNKMIVWAAGQAEKAAKFILGITE